MARSPDTTRPLDIVEEKPKPFEPMGAPGTAVYGGFIVEGEKDNSLRGTEKYLTYSDILANSTIIAAGVRFFLNLVAKANWRIEPADDSTEAAKYAELVDEIIRDMDTPWHRIVRRAAMFRFYGFGIQEWTAKRREDGTIGFLDVEPRPQSTITRWDIDPQGGVLGVIQTDPQTGRDIYLPRSKIVYMCDDSLNDSPEGLGLFRHLAKTAKKLEKFELLESWGFETDLRGIPVSRIPLARLQQLVEEKKLTAAQVTALRAPFEAFIDKHSKNPALGLLMDSAVYRSEGEQKTPSGTPLWSVELLKGDGGPHSEVAAAIERLNREMARVLGVEQLLLGSDSKGSHALATDKTQSFGMIVDSTLVEMREQFHKDILGPIWELNGWPKELKPKFKTESIQYRDVAQIVQALEGLAKSGAPLSPNDPAINEVRDQVGLTHAPEQDLSVGPAGEVLAQPLGPDGEKLPKADVEPEEPEEPPPDDGAPADGGDGEDLSIKKRAYVRHPRGSPIGGQFAPKGGGGGIGGDISAVGGGSLNPQQDSALRQIEGAFRAHPNGKVGMSAVTAIRNNGLTKESSNRIKAQLMQLKMYSTLHAFDVLTGKE